MRLLTAPPKQVMKFYLPILLMLCGGLTHSVLPAATIDLGSSSQIDWLAAASGEMPPSILANQAGTTGATLSIANLTGQSPPGAIVSSVLPDPHWLSTVPTEDGTVPVLKFRLLPSLGMLQFETRLAISLLGADGLLLCVGGLDGQTGASLRIRGLNAEGQLTALPQFLGTAAWNPGTGGYLQPLTWEPLQQSLQPSGMTAGATELGWLWFTAEDLTQIELTYEGGTPRTSGEGFLLGLGLVYIPEPQSAGLLLLSAFFAAGISRGRLRRR